MFVTNNARILLSSWRSFARGLGQMAPLSDNDYILCEYAVEKLGKRDFNKVVGDYFGARGRPDINEFMRSLGLKIDRTDPKRIAAEALYVLLGTDLFLTDYPAPSKMYLTEELYGMSAAAHVAAPQAVDQCIKYGARHWAYFKTVITQAVAVQECEDAIEAETLNAMRLPPGYFEQMGTSSIEGVETMRRDLQTHVEDQRIEKANAKED